MAEMQKIEFTVSANVDGAVGNLNRLIGKLNQANKTASGANGYRRLSASLQGASQSASRLNKVLSALKRVTFYRAIRSAIKAFTDAFREGLQNAYAFSQGLSNAVDRRIATALDSMTSAALKMKNQFGAAFGSLLTALAPLINTLISWLTAAANAITQLFAAFTGGTYLRAKDVSAQFADNMKKGAGSAREWKNQLMGFDVINRLEEPSKGGGGSNTGIDPSEMFEVAEVEGRFARFAQAIRDNFEAIKTLAIDIATALVAWKLSGFLGHLGAIGQALQYILGIALAIYGTWKFIEGFIDAWKNGISIENLSAQIGGAAIAVAGLGMAFGSVGSSVGMLVFGVSLITEALHDLAVNGKLSGEALSALVIGITAVGAAIGILTGSWIAPAVAIIGSLAIAIHHFWDDIAGWLPSLAKKLEDAGHEALAGFLNAFVEWGNKAHQWVDEHIVNPFVTWIKNLFGIHSPSTVMDGIGRNIITGFLNGMKGVWGSVTTWFDGVLNGLINGIRSICGWIQSALDGFGLLNMANANAARIQQDGSMYLQGFSAGGYPASGQLFLARESGPELVGSMGGRTAVANNDQIVEGIKAGVFEAVVSAMSGNGGNGQPVCIYLDGREIARTTTKYQNQMGRAGA